jgi:3-hydroxy-9,10-secoandrosta-1,3,5(10)-triene-9,17-dione monooxygenase
VHGDLRELPAVTPLDGRGRDDDPVRRASALVPLLARNAARAEAERRLPEENLDALTASGLLRILLPRRLGGEERSLTTHIDVCAELARGCGATAWVAMIMSSGAWILARLCDHAQEDVFGDTPDARICGVLTPSSRIAPVGSGYRVSGRWGFCSGSLHADWFLLATPPTPEQAAGLCLVPGSDVAIEDTWFTMGMRGTGSNTVVADDIFVPTHRFRAIPDILAGPPNARPSEALYRSEFGPTTVAFLVGPVLGMARAALDHVVAKAPTRGVTSTSYARQSTAPVVQLAVARAAQLVDLARLHVHQVLGEVADSAARGVRLGYADRARCRFAVASAAQRSVEAIRLLVGAHGSAAFAESSILQRLLRDAETAASHALLNPEIAAEIHGRTLLGVAEPLSPFV